MQEIQTTDASLVLAPHEYRGEQKAVTTIFHTSTSLPSQTRPHTGKGKKTGRGRKRGEYAPAEEEEEIVSHPFLLGGKREMKYILPF